MESFHLHSETQRLVAHQQEIGHTLGLGHVAQDRASIMTPVISRNRWSDPDRQALAYLGRYSCRTI